MDYCHLPESCGGELCGRDANVLLFEMLSTTIELLSAEKTLYSHVASDPSLQYDVALDRSYAAPTLTLLLIQPFHTLQ